MTLTALSLFSGAGGLDLGVAAAGFSVVGAIEIDPVCCATLARNGYSNVACSPVTSSSVTAVLDCAGLSKVDLLFGGPPCQPFSKSAAWAKSARLEMDDPRAQCIDAFLEAVCIVRPKAMLIENVEGFARSSAGNVDYVARAIQRINAIHGTSYRFYWRVLNSADFGVPQFRRRVFLVAVQSDDYRFPMPTHGPHLEPHVTAWDAIGHLEMSGATLKARGRWAGLLPSIPEGENYIWHTPRGGGTPIFGYRTKFWSFLQKLAKNKPSLTITANPAQNAGPFHWKNRPLSIEEVAALQTFPEKFSFCGSFDEARRQAGNAVPPLLAQRVAQSIASCLGSKDVPASKFEIPTGRNGPVPPPEMCLPIPAEYMRLVGPHPAHPGAGRGPKPRNAVARA